jgi:2,3-dihydroxybiphenyl 1,2-dioxygenase
MNPTIELGYLGIDVSDHAAFDKYLGDIVGLVPGQPAPGGATTWRNDTKAQRIVVHQGDTNDAAYLGFVASDDDQFEVAVARLEAAGAGIVEGTAEERAGRRVARLVWTTAPWGTRIEVAAGLEEAAEPFNSALMPMGFLTDGIGFGHVALAVSNDDAERANSFAVDALGLRQSDWIETDLGGIPIVVHFYHCNPRHHTLAIAQLPFDPPQKLHHVMVETVERDSVGLAWDRAWNAGVPIANALGKHDNDKMFSFYAVTPAGFQLEIGYGARTVTDDWHDNRRYDRISMWGHQPIASPFHP